MPPNCILWGKFRKSVVFSKKVVITFSHFVLGTFFLLSICWTMDGQQGVVPPWNRFDQCVTSYGTLNLKNTSLTPIFDHIQIIISQRQVVVQQRSLARCPTDWPTFRMQPLAILVVWTKLHFLGKNRQKMENRRNWRHKMAKKSNFK